MSLTGMVKATQDSPPELQQGVSRMVKQAGADTTTRNAIRDGAEWAWVPHGDACPFCRMLASNGWQKASKNLLKKGHAQHIHANCDCEFAVRFSREFDVAGYDPEAYLRQYRAAGSDINSWRRIDYAARKDAINAQKRAAYAVRNETEAAALAKNPKNWEALLNRQSESYFKKLGDSQMTLLSDEEKRALRDWSGGYYGDINGFMRYGRNVSKETRRMAETISEALDKTTLPDDLIVKREVSENAIDTLLQTVPNWRENLGETVGKTITDKGFFSTSPLESGGLSDDVKFLVKCPAGIHGAYMASVSHAEGEKELLLQAGYSFIIRNAEMQTNPGETTQTVFWLEVIP